MVHERCIYGKIRYARRGSTISHEVISANSIRDSASGAPQYHQPRFFFLFGLPRSKNEKEKKKMVFLPISRH